MRWVLPFVLLGCAGGQTGEITELTECERVVERVPIADLPEDTAEQLASATEPHEAELVWADDGGVTQVEIEAELDDDTADRLGPGDCAKVVRVPANVHVETADERVDVTVAGWLDLAEELVTIQGGAAVTSLNGRDPPADEIEVWLWMQQTDDERIGSLSIDGTDAASF